MKRHATQIGFHNLHDAEVHEQSSLASMNYRVRFENFFHPYVGDLIKTLNLKSLKGLLDPEYHEGLATAFFNDFYAPSTDFGVPFDTSPKEIDIAVGGPYATYNWELLFHIPLTIAVHLSKNQRFAEAQHWFHYIFNPTSSDISIDPPLRFWNFLAFRKDDNPTQIDTLLKLLSKPANLCSANELELKEKTLAGYEAIKDKPFQPHAIARTRHLAYQYYVVMKYLDNLIAWGDSLFRQDTIESINEATQRYVLAANILGPKPQAIPSQGTLRPKTYAQLKSAGLDPMGNALVELEGNFPFNLGLPHTQNNNGSAAGPLFGIGRSLYFCIPRNEKLLGYWDTVADRLFKIRRCMNIEGVVRQLTLFDPPIDPGMLVKAAAAGINIGSIVSGLNQPISQMRSLFLIQKAVELAGEVRGLGQSLLSTLEKVDGERLTLLRQGHEIKIQKMQQEIRFLQWKQAQESSESLLKSRASAVDRYRYYQRLLGLSRDDANVPDTFSLSAPELTEENFDEAFATLVGQFDKAIATQAFPPLQIAGDTSPSNQSGASGQGRLSLNTNENMELSVHSPNAQENRDWASRLDMTASTFASIPGFSIKMHFWGLGASTDIPLGTILSNAARAVGSHFSNNAQNEDRKGQNAAKTGSYERRADEWILQLNLTAHELKQLGRQIISSLIAEQIAHHEYQTVIKQIEQSEETDRFLHEKFTNEELYSWMQGEISRLYYEYYRFAFDTARKAEQTMKRELMRPEVDATDYIKFNYWDAGRKGLLSSESLYLDLKRMEIAYHENNKREYELTRHVSLRQLDPIALLTLKVTGTCEVTIPEWIFDLDNPGHYLRRIKNVSLTIPSVSGPYTSVSCTLSLMKSSLRKSPLGDNYVRQSNEDNRFVDYYGTIQSIVTSTGNNDSGMFETNLRDEKFLPFEGAGAESSWRVELPADFRQFDYDTISDVVLHVRYTARQGGATLKEKAVGQLREMVAEANPTGLALLFSLKHDFPNQWHRFVTDNGNQNFRALLTLDHFPYFTQGKAINVTAVWVNTIKDGSVESAEIEADLEALNSGLNDAQTKSAELEVAASDLDKDANVFIVLKYSLGSAG